MTDKEKYLTQCIRHLYLHTHSYQNLNKKIVKRMQDRNQEFVAARRLLFECPSYARCACYNDCDKCWKDFFKGFDEVIDL